ncbi:MAG: hypothetical protein IPP71_19395 [Bacteroidetes bacterium]|nr:hypothetical protein [Bacteroidota bacterium]
MSYSSSTLLPTIIAPDSIIWDNVEFLINKEIEIECEVLLPNSQGVLLNYEAFIQLYDSLGNMVFQDST